MNEIEKHKILCMLAYNYGEICKAHNIVTDNNNNWAKAIECLKHDQEINGENFLLVMLQKDEEIT